MDFSKIISDLKGLGRGRLMAAGAVVAGLLAVLILLAVTSMGGREMALLYSGLEQKKAGEVVNQLETMGVPYEIRAGGGAIFVASDRVARVRMKLAEQGLPNSGAKGYELLDSQNPLGMTDFMQRVQRVRALQGELSQSISTMNGVETARVHIVMPERQPFSRETPAPKASVVVEAGGAGGFGESKAAAVRSLVSSAVPGLEPASVTVTDQNGSVLAADGDSNAARASDLEDVRSARETAVEKAVRQVLAPGFGADNVRVSVSAKIKTENERVTEEIYDPEGRVLRSSQRVQQSEESQRQAPGNVSAGENTPADGAGGGGGQSNSQSERVEQTQNYEISSTVRQIDRPAGAVESLSVAVVVDGSYDENGDYQELDDAQIERIRNLVQSAMGYEEGRGDAISVENVKFRDDARGTGPSSAAGGDGEPMVSLFDMVAIAVGASVLTLVALVLLRLFGGRKEDEEAEQNLLQRVEQGQLGAEAQADGSATVSIGDNKHKVSAETMETVNNAIDERPEDIAFLVRQMIDEDKAGAS